MKVLSCAAVNVIAVVKAQIDVKHTGGCVCPTDDSGNVTSPFFFHFMGVFAPLCTSVLKHNGCQKNSWGMVLKLLPRG